MAEIDKEIYSIYGNICEAISYTSVKNENLILYSDAIDARMYLILEHEVWCLKFVYRVLAF